MGWLLTADQMRKAEEEAVRRDALAPGVLMERAGSAVVEAIFSRWPALAAGRLRVLVLCGPGNNGGDGYVIARRLADWGANVRILEMSDDPGSREAALHRERALAAGVPVLGIDEFGAPEVEAVDLVVDALFGIGLSRPLEGVIAELVRGIGQRTGAARVVAVDMPSGLDGDSGRIPSGGVAIRADLTVTFHTAKPGHYLARGPEHCGALVVADIGIGPSAPGPGLVARLARPDAARLAKGGAGHKYSHGHALILGGPPGAGGAARLAARAALRVGAGLVTLAVPKGALAENAARLDAVMLAGLGEGRDLPALLADARIASVCAGPGLGMGNGTGPGSAVATRALVGEILADGRAAVLDADALSAHADHAEALFSRLHDKVVLTPHGGEFARLFPDLAAMLDDQAGKGRAPSSRLAVVRAAAARAGCCVLLKGPDTVIADATGASVINAAAYERVAPWLATAGSGDVLSGLIAGLMARGFAPLAAAETGAWLHVEAAREFGPGLIAEDLPEMLPIVFRRLFAE
ncbi:hypothetical protein BV394_00245 [Brevirhabdus pacifica]|uniref:Bifunctional NAD(P)H-hydrate repair enzyme n=2 Tax=Brevirhabdus pacifica TaxID=1267768 RepID=A0A1U7DEM8_9RHOB|nr:bifunctional ADP-dependent NAD(P)H-hydrate dehydratase/NAD(P)H-hydrate epimerase [Brevirhabdus pacifica]APX88353.1 hypothetical protein BV394_00245 [Brevirhabdus pacifica]OWU79674.1 hypothetical protein ATO5_00940 [Loktanella sp. 22II-4b]PJJ87194.1 hydroxyethylthiazole kinase-like uncharacterized protein yjeF/hydroxyethylthiazole kinase-like uncharacterized protein yjeF [Brevirhabdus pacifica]